MLDGKTVENKGELILSYSLNSTYNFCVLKNLQFRFQSSGFMSQSHLVGLSAMLFILFQWNHGENKSRPDKCYCIASDFEGGG